MKKIVMVVNNSATNDYRVVKTAELVAEAGYESHVVGILTPGFTEKEKINGVTYHRFKRKLGFTALFAGFFPQLYVNMRLASLRKGKSAQGKNDYSENNLNSLFVRSINLIFFFFGVLVFILKKITATAKATVIKKKILYVVKKLNNFVKYGLKRFYCLILRRLNLFRADKCVLGVRHLQGSYLTTFFPVLYELEADIYHAHELWVLESCALASNSLGSKLVYDSHELERHRNLNWKESPKKSRIKDEEKYISHVDEVFAVSEGCAKVIKDDYNLEKVHLLRNSPVLKKMEKSPGNLRKDLNLDSDTPLLVYTGSVTFNRGLELIIESLKELTKFHFVAVGPHNEGVKNELLSKAKESNISERFHLHEKVPPMELIDFISSADVAVIPIQNACLSYYYCMPNKLFEAAFAGLPIVASRLPDMERFINKYDLGETFESDNVRSLIDAVRNVYEKKDQLMTKDKVLAVENENCYEKEIGSLLNVYKKLL